MNPADIDELHSLRAENARLRSTMGLLRTPLLRAQQAIQKSRDLQPDNEAPGRSARDMEAALSVALAQSNTFNDVSRLLAEHLQQMLNLAHTKQQPTADALDKAQEALDLINHLQTLWPLNES